MILEGVMFDAGETHNSRMCCSSESNQAMNVDDHIIFHALREEFIKNRKVGTFEVDDEAERIPRDFNYGRYLGICMGKTLAHVVEVDWVTWSCIGLFAAFFYGLMLACRDNIKSLGYIFLAVGWGIFFFSVIFERKCIHIRNAFAPAGFTQRLAVKHLTRQERAFSGEMFKLLDDVEMPAWTTIDRGKYKLESRTKFWKWALGPAPNRQHLLFWGQTYGAELSLLLVRLILLTNGVYGAVMVVTFIPEFYRDSLDGESWKCILFTVVAACPLFLQLLCMRRLVASMSHILCIGVHRRPQIVAKVLREEKSQRAVRAFVVLHTLSMACKKKMGGDVSMQSGPGTPRKQASTPQVKALERQSNPMPSGMEDEIGKTFDLFDRDKSGEISSEELGSLMLSLGETLTDEQITVMVGLIDYDHDGTISKAEFMQWYGEQMLKVDLNPHAIASAIFSMIDRDGSGKLSLQEFKESLDALDVGLSLEDISDLIKDLDQDRNGFIDEEEFGEFMKQHMHPPADNAMKTMY
jgi:calmodulin